MANLIQSAKAQVSQLTAQAYEAAVAAGALPAGVELKGSVEIPKDPQNGDYASSVAMAGAKAMKMAPAPLPRPWWTTWILPAPSSPPWRSPAPAS